MDVIGLERMVFAPIVVLDYTNHRGVISRRNVIPVRIWYGESSFHDGEQSFLCAFDIEKNDVRDFAIKDIHAWEEAVREHLSMAGVPRSPHWPKVRKEHLLLQPTCMGCGTDRNLEVHHIQPFHLFPDLELVQSNLITLCETPSRNCHFREGHCYNWKKYNPNVIEDAARSLAQLENARDA